MIASESVALDALGYEVVRDVLPGEALFVTTKGVISRQCIPTASSCPCIFEYVYFARPDSVIDGISVYHARLNMGEFLAKTIAQQMPVQDIDVIVPVPDTSRTAALQISSMLGIPYREGFIKNRYIGRTFIMPGQSLRRQAVRRKLNAIKIEFEGKNVMIIDGKVILNIGKVRINS
jgi:amidophosphoribosyltransferase